MSLSLLNAAQQAQYRAAISSVFWSFARPFQVSIQAQVAIINTSLSVPYSPFGLHDQNAAITVENPAVTPQNYTITGCILYGDNQPWPFATPDGGGADAQQLKLRESIGKVRIKVEATGYEILRQAQTVVLDDFTFEVVSTPRPHGIVGAPDRWTLHLERKD